ELQRGAEAVGGQHAEATDDQRVDRLGADPALERRQCRDAAQRSVPSAQLDHAVQDHGRSRRLRGTVEGCERVRRGMNEVLPLEGIYLHLVRNGVPVSVREYQEAIAALAAGHGGLRRERLQLLCETLWWRRPGGSIER